ncbi:MAG: 8-oxo-dGTP diphosphatase [Oscillospiraceae bacterium]|nr:8-oxo-dGTP diphosphatase [Oscillospiraceae bacterium]
MPRTEQVELTNMCMICREDKVLVIDRKKPDWPGITFPGGHVEPGESVVDSVVREIREETGLTIAAPVLCGTVGWCDEGRRYLVFLYKASRFTGELRASDEGEVWWERLSELPRLRLTSGMTNYLRVFCEEPLSELFYRKAGDGWIEELK